MNHKRVLFLLCALVVVTIGLCEPTNPPAAPPPAPPKQLESAKTMPSLLPTADATARPATAAKRQLVYIVPKLIVIQTADGPMICIAEHHAKELAALLPTAVVTNVPVYALVP